MMTSVTVGLLKAVCVFRVKTRAKIWQLAATLIQLWGNLYTVFLLRVFSPFFNLESRHEWDVFTCLGFVPSVHLYILKMDNL